MHEDVDKKEMGGVAFTNGGRISDKQPDWVGKCTIKGRAYSIALWSKNSQRTGVPMMTMSFREDFGADYDPKWYETDSLVNDLLSVTQRVRKAMDVSGAPKQALSSAFKSLIKAEEELYAVVSPERTSTPFLF